MKLMEMSGNWLDAYENIGGRGNAGTAGSHDREVVQIEYTARHAQAIILSRHLVCIEANYSTANAIKLIDSQNPLLERSLFGHNEI